MKRLEDKDFIYVPSINLWVAKEVSMVNVNKKDCSKFLKGIGEKMLNLPELIEFLKYTKKNHKDIYEGIIDTSKTTHRLEWIDLNYDLNTSLTKSVQVTRPLIRNDYRGKEYTIKSTYFINIPSSFKYLHIFYHVTSKEGKTIRKNEKACKNSLVFSAADDFSISFSDWLNKHHTKQGLPSKGIKKGNFLYYPLYNDHNYKGTVFGIDEGKLILDLNALSTHRDELWSFGVRRSFREKNNLLPKSPQ